MAAAEKLSFIIPGTSPVFAGVKQPASSVVALLEPAPEGAPRRTGVQLTSQAPRLADKPDDYIDELVAYMDAVLSFTVATAGDQAKISNIQTSMGQSYVQETKDAAEKAVEDLKAAQEAAEKAQHKSILQNILSSVGAGLMFLVGAATGDPALCIMAALMLADSQTGVSSKLNNYLDDHCGEVGGIFAKIGVAIAMAVVVGGISGALRAGVETATSSAAARVAADGAGVADGAAGVADGAAAAKPQPSFWEKVVQYGFKNGKGYKGYGQLISQTVQMTMFVNPFTNILQASLEIPGIPLSDDTKKLIAKIAGTAVAIMLAMYTARFTGAPGEGNIVQALVDRLGQSGATALKLGMKVATFAITIAGAAYGVEAGQADEANATATKALGDAQGLQALCQSFVRQIGEMVEQLQSSTKSVDEALASMNDRWASYVAPYQMASRA